MTKSNREKTLVLYRRILREKWHPKSEKRIYRYCAFCIDTKRSTDGSIACDRCKIDPSLCKENTISRRIVQHIPENLQWYRIEISEIPRDNILKIMREIAECYKTVYEQ